MILRLFLALACCASPLFAADVLLRLAPDTHSKIIARLDSSHAAFKQAGPVKDSELAADGWHYTELNATVTGHISTQRLAKDFSIQPGTLIRASARQTARVLTVVEEDDQIEVDTTTATAQWTRVRFNKPVPVYYLKGDLPETSAMDSPSIQPIETGPASYTDPSQLPPEKVVWKRVEVDSIYDPQPFEKKRNRATVLVQETVPVMPAARPDPPKPQALVDSATDDGRSAPQRPATNTVGTVQVEGKLIREYGDGAPYSLQLEANETPLTYVDISKVFINDLRPYLDQHVKIRGTLRPLVVGSETRVIEVQEIELPE